MFGQFVHTRVRSPRNRLRHMFCLVISCLMMCQAVADIESDLKQCQALEDDDPAAAVALAQKLISELDVSHDPVPYGHALGCLGWGHATLGENDLAQKQAGTLEILAAGLPVNADSVTLMRRAGSIYHRIGNRISATEAYASAMYRAGETGLKAEQIPLLVNLGVLHSEIREHNRAIANYTMALELMDQLDDRRYEAPVLFNLAVTLDGQGDYEKSLLIYDRVVDLINEHWPVSRVALIYQGLASGHAGVGDYETALGHIEKALEMLEQLDQQGDLMSALTTHASILLHNGRSDLARAQIDRAYDFFIVNANEVGDSGPLSAMVSVYERLGETDRALEALKLARDNDREFQQSFNKQSMAEMEARLRDSQQREELAQLRSHNAETETQLAQASLNRWRWLMSAGFVLVAGTAFLFWQMRMNRRLRRISMRDSLTRLGNRRAINHWLEQHPFPEPPQVRILWLIDLDHFKAVNDSHGHEVGDLLLVEIANCLKSEIDSDRFVGRWGGEEFMLLSDDIPTERIDEYAERLLRKIEDTVIRTDQGQLAVTASIGISVISDENRGGWNNALSEADRALYEAKDSGRSCYVNSIS